MIDSLKPLLLLFGEERIGPNLLVLKTLLGVEFSNKGLHIWS